MVHPYHEVLWKFKRESSLRLIWSDLQDLLFSERRKVKIVIRASLVAQWLRICLPMQGTWVQALVWEDPTCCRATKPVHHNYWACALQPACHNYWSPHATREATAMRSPHTTMKSSLRSLQLEKAHRKPACSNEDPTQPKIK